MSLSTFNCLENSWRNTQVKISQLRYFQNSPGDHSVNPHFTNRAGDQDAGGQPVQLPVGRVRVRHRDVRDAGRPAALLPRQQQGPDPVHGGQGLPQAGPDQAAFRHAQGAAPPHRGLHQVQQGGAAALQADPRLVGGLPQEPPQDQQVGVRAQHEPHPAAVRRLHLHLFQSQDARQLRAEQFPVLLVWHGEYLGGMRVFPCRLFVW